MEEAGDRADKVEGGIRQASKAAEENENVLITPVPCWNVLLY